MTTDAMIPVSLIFSFIAAVGVFYNIKNSKNNEQSGATKKEVEIAKMFTELNVKIDILQKQISEFARINEKKSDEIVTINHEIMTINGKLLRLFEYKDEMEKKIEKMEGGKQNGKNHDSIRKA